MIPIRMKQVKWQFAEGFQQQIHNAVMTITEVKLYGEGCRKTNLNGTGHNLVALGLVVDSSWPL